MTAALRAEWLKLVTTRTFYLMTATAAVLSGFIVFGLIAKQSPPWSMGPERFLELPGVLGITSGLFGLILGQRIFTDEFRYGTIAHTMFSDPHRTRSTIAKALVAFGGGLIVMTATLVLTFAVIFGMTTGTGGTLDMGGLAPSVGGGLLLGGALWFVLGVALGALVRQPVPAVVVGVFWLLGIESMAGALIGPVANYLPGKAAQVMAGGVASDALVAAGVMTAWAVGLWAIGLITLRRRDVL